MQITKEILESERRAYMAQAQSAQGIVNYIDQLLAYVERPEPMDIEEAPEPPLTEETPNEDVA